ncbi:Serine/threonine protein phosphatase [Sterolibacterium denitrificans]|uniref:Serine/threonine protein phosphatase n=1 Tax=Sterolibacterium denitrificans TaxID=157592 RepID=A0A7Z7HPZ6_9PROT|nr:PP2C family serine/threonine-protein phosphatase [Sterolibacterium denitrificans]SMB22874.1 Serine/threonine protein phosphatase [Sterolibacterium denitrificans]
MKFSIFQESRIGKRKSNQDRMNYSYTRDALLMVVADGMGGHLHGELAAQIAVQTLSESFKSQARTLLADPFQFLSRSLSQAHLAINQYAGKHGLSEAPRTTCIACVVQNNTAHWAHVGDSRLYVIRDAAVLAQTRDHSHVKMLLEQGKIDAAEAARHPARNLVYSCLGGPNPPEIEFSRKTPLQKGDVIALCTDGVWSPFTDDALVRTLATHTPMAAVPQLLDQAEHLAGRHCDNLTLLAMQWESSLADSSSLAGASNMDKPS